MPLKPGTVWYCTAGLMGGSNLAYLLAVMLSLLLPSWPFNGFFTPLAVMSLLLQAPYVWRPAESHAWHWRQGAALGGASVALFWLFYCYGLPT
ncbi:hypothetical protein [Pseudomonas sp. Gutcm_11s]|uniref:hypothetical protein n=1 Tax=Pseudomonas sp. Gutcm_11s TaxID=3026088 RepID=UPI00236133A2|nr:hypothetical protein [Pseudomonas sp. Gutcm_11s]MDD0842131.1 hypothetical protein [Pseudomonas sp. Gutcm_11s]